MVLKMSIWTSYNVFMRALTHHRVRLDVEMGWSRWTLIERRYGCWGMPVSKVTWSKRHGNGLCKSLLRGINFRRELRYKPQYHYPAMTRKLKRITYMLVSEGMLCFHCLRYVTVLEKACTTTSRISTSLRLVNICRCFARPIIPWKVWRN